MWSKATEVSLCAESLEVNLDMDTFDNRLLLQKSIYLMQVFGVDIGYRFGWYLRGPYCSDLTKTGFEVKEHMGCSKVDFALPDSIVKRIQFFKKWETETKPEYMAEVEWLELLASLHYLKHIAYIREGKSKDIVCSELVSRKSWYEMGHVEKAWEVLDQAGLIEKSKVS